MDRICFPQWHSELKMDSQSYFILLSVSPRRECIQLWATEVGILVDSQGEFGPADMPDFASQLSDLLAHLWGDRVERPLQERDFYETNAATKDFRAARAHLGPKLSRCHVGSIYVDVCPKKCMSHSSRYTDPHPNPTPPR